MKERLLKFIIMLIISPIVILCFLIAIIVLIISPVIAFLFPDSINIKY